MAALRLILLVFIALTLPKAWQKMKGADPHLFSRKFSSCQTRFDAGSNGAFSQPYFYGGKGTQFYVFFSEDGRLVLKIPRASKMRESLIDRVIQRPMRKPDVNRSLRIAFDYFKEETAVIAVHYGQMEHRIWPSVRIYDRLRRPWIVDLNRSPFALQKRQALLSASLRLAEDADESKRLLTAYLDLIEKETKRGWMNSDNAFWRNVGIDGPRATRIDLGSYVPIDGTFSWHKAAKPVSRYLKGHDPILKKWFDRQVDLREGS